MRVIATSLLVNNVLMGFFQGFLVAYLYLPKVFAAAKQSSERSTPGGGLQPAGGAGELG
jgi:hypothetical protein